MLFAYSLQVMHIFVLFQRNMYNHLSVWLLLGFDNYHESDCEAVHSMCATLLNMQLS